MTCHFNATFRPSRASSHIQPWYWAVLLSFRPHTSVPTESSIIFDCIPFIKCWLPEVLHCTALHCTYVHAICVVFSVSEDPLSVICVMCQSMKTPFSVIGVVCQSMKTHSPKMLHVNVRRCVQSLIRYSRFRYRHAILFLSVCYFRHVRVVCLHYIWTPFTCHAHR